MEAKTTDSAKKHVLVVDDDDVFRGALCQTLKLEGFQLTQATHGNLAKDVLAVQDFDIVISDINMPGISGIELMRYTKTIKPNLPFILMTGFSELKETKEAYELGARGFLAKPFKKEDLLAVIKEWLYPKSGQLKKEEEDQDLNYCKLAIDDFVSGNKVQFDIYIRLSAKKYIKVAHSGDDLPIERINSYKAKNIQYLYMEKVDFTKYLSLNLTLLPLVTAKSDISLEKKRNFLKHTSDVIMEQLYLQGVDEEGFQNAKIVVESTTSLLTESSDMMNILSMLDSHADHLYSHALGVSAYSVMIAKEVQWHSAANIFKVAMGGLMHDIGKKEIPREILDKQRKDMTAKEIQLYETHPQRGMEILSQIPTVPSDVLQIVMQHHENCMGLGFPLKLSKRIIHPMAKVVSVANEFCSLVLKGPQSMGLSPTGAILRMTTVQPDKFERQFLSALMRIFKIPDTLPKSKDKNGA
ncbi:MAG: HD domain-containing phosphohydrolase [Bdellovibrionia bacterium]